MYTDTISESPLPRMLTVAEAAAELRVSRRTIAAWISAGRLRTAKMTPGPGSGRRLVPRTELERLLSECMEG